MTITQNSKEIQINISKNIDVALLQRIVDYINYLETTSKSKAKQKDADQLAEEVNSNWWKENKSKFLQ